MSVCSREIFYLRLYGLEILLKNVVVSVTSDTYERIEHYALSALLGDEHISIDLEITVAVRHLRAFNNRIELSV